MNSSIDLKLTFDITKNEDGALSLDIEKLLKKERLSQQIPNKNITN